jgi:hypothetical protein
LGIARNIGAIEAAGEILVICDSRILPEHDSIGKFANRLLAAGKRKVWVFGDKGADKRTFVENFSAIKRDQYIKGGMCNERIDAYGGMSQELRGRFTWQGFDFEYLPAARATTMIGSHSNENKRQQIIKSKLKLWKMGY